MGLLIAIALVLGGACSVGVEAGDEEARLLALVNGSRAEHGLPALARDETLDRFARVNSRRMLREERMRHSDPASFRPLGLRAWAENVAYGPDIERLHRRMLDSTRHRQNMLGPYTLVGIAVERGADGQRYVTEAFGRR